MKRLIMINGTMGAGKTATCKELLNILDRSVFLDGDWCWNMKPFVVTDETKQMVVDNIAHLLRNFLVCSEYENVLFCWVMQYESIMEDILNRLGGAEFSLYKFTLQVSAQALTQRIQKDVGNHVRTIDVLERSLARLPLYENMDTIKIDVSSSTARQAAQQIRSRIDAIEKPIFRREDDPEALKRRMYFTGNAANYDRWRPRYLPEVFEDIKRYSQIDSNKKALEIGIGTGQATEPFLKTGCGLTAVEIGKNLADYSREKFRAYSNLNIVNIPFEDYAAADGSFDLIYSATAFHWIPEEIGFKKAFRLLKSGGVLALWWNRPFPGKTGGQFYEDIQKVYQKYRPSPKERPVVNDSSRYKKIQETILSYGFTDLKFKLYHGVRNFCADDYVGLLNTYSDHRNMTPDIRRKFESGIRQAIQNHGNRLTVCDTIDLYLARKP